MKILITGGAGFIGSNLADAVIADGRACHIVDNLSNGQMIRVPSEAEFHETDMAGELAGKVRPLLVIAATAADAQALGRDPQQRFVWQTLWQPQASPASGGAPEEPAANTPPQPS